MSNGKNIKGNGKDLLSIFERTGCLAEDVLFNYINDGLSANEKKVVEAHLLDCPLCSDALEGMALLSGKQFKLRTADIRSQVGILAGIGKGRVVKLKTWRFAVAAAVMGVMITSAWLIMRQLDDRSEEVAINTFKKNYETPPVLERDRQPMTDSLFLVEATDAEKAEVLELNQPIVAEERTMREAAAKDEAEDMHSIPVVTDRRGDDLTIANGSSSQDTVTTFSTLGVASGGTNAPTYTWSPSATSTTDIQTTESLDEVTIAGGRDAKPESKRLTKSEEKNVNQAGYDNDQSNDKVPAQDPLVKQQLLDDGVTYYSNKQHNEALGNFNQVLLVEPANETALFYSAISYIEQGQPAKAVTNLEKVLQNKSSAYYDSAQWYRAMALLNEGQSKPAKKQLNEIIGTGSPYEGKAREALDGL